MSRKTDKGLDKATGEAGGLGTPRPRGKRAGDRHKEKVIGIRLPDKLFAEVERRAAREGISVYAWLRALIEKELSGKPPKERGG